jgi:hypothetical protein
MLMPFVSQIPLFQVVIGIPAMSFTADSLRRGRWRRSPATEDEEVTTDRLATHVPTFETSFRVRTFFSVRRIVSAQRPLFPYEQCHWGRL